MLDFHSWCHIHNSGANFKQNSSASMCRPVTKIPCKHHREKFTLKQVKVDKRERICLGDALIIVSNEIIRTRQIAAKVQRNNKIFIDSL